MCEGCVAEGFLTAETLRKLDEFCELWPGAAFGPAHIVLSDANVEDEHLDYCIRGCEALLLGDRNHLPESDRYLYDLHCGEIDAAELAATVEFLRSLRRIPEAGR
jgi:hypothetical protein